MLQFKLWKATTFFYIFTLTLWQSIYGAVIPLTTTTTSDLAAFETMDMQQPYAYPSHPNEILPIQPVLIYPKPRKFYYEGRNLDKNDDDIIYVKLLKRKSYHPKHNENIPPSRELTMKDIFYVKALANGQFSQRRLKVYQLPEFFAINVYHKGEGI